MNIDENTKLIQKGYCKSVLASQGELTKAVYDKINNGDEQTIRKVFENQQQRIKESAVLITNPIDKEITLSQIDSIQEVLDALTSILNFENADT